MNRSNPLLPAPALPTRRQALKAVGGLGALALLACGGVDDPNRTDGGTFGASDGGVTGTFAVGSGAFLADKTYANPFASGLGGASCVAYKSATAGPCHSNTYDRQDLSDGLVGLPTRLELLVVDTSCNPVPNAVVEVWYASPAGTYSAAKTAESGSYQGAYSDLNVAFCTGNAAAALSSNWLRGYRTAGSDGRVTFDGIYPGWYASRTTHIHFKVTVGAQAYVTSQLFVDDAVNAQVYGGHGSYASRGQKDTANTNDKVIQESGLTLSSVVMSYELQSDGALVLWKAITIA